MLKKFKKDIYPKKSKLKGVDAEFIKWLDEFNKENKDVLRELAKR